MKNLIEIDEIYLQQDNDIDMNHEVESTKQTSAIVAKTIKIKSLCKIMYHIFHNDRIKCA